MNLFAYLLEYNRYWNGIGIAAILLIAFLFSKNRAAINFKLVRNALILQFLTAFAMLKTVSGQRVVQTIANIVNSLYQFADKGSSFIFGNLTDPAESWGFIFGFKVLPIIIFFGALMSWLFYAGVVQRFVSAISYVVRPLLGTSGSETLCAIANSFLGQTEAPLLVRSYLHGMTKSEMMLVMISGMATISGAILAVFAAMGVPVVHLLTASVMGIPASILISKIIYPETELSETAAGATAQFSSDAKNSIDAISTGTSDGLQLALNVGAMLISFLSLLALIDAALGYGSTLVNTYLGLGIPVMSLNWIFSYIFAPFGYMLGLTGEEALKAGQLLGTKVSINELIAYSEMVTMNLSDRAQALLTYALCGFSNFSCIGIQVGGIGALVPEKRAWLCELGLYAVLGGALANLLSAMVVGLIL